MEQATVSLPDKFIRSEAYKALTSTLKGTDSLPFEGDKWSSLQKQSGLRHPTYASSFIRQVCVAGLVMVGCVCLVCCCLCGSYGCCVEGMVFVLRE